MDGLLRLAGVVTSVGLANSLNPETVGPALYLATGRKRIRRVSQFTSAFFAVTFAAGLVLTIGPGRLLLGLVPHPERTIRHVIELVAGVILLLFAVALWVRRRSLARRELPTGAVGGSSAVVAGASIALVGLPTAIPYFAVIAAIVASSATHPQEIALLALFNVAFVLPLLAMIVALLVAGERAQRHLDRAGAWLQRQWPAVFAGLLFFVGAILVLLGGLAS